MPRGVRKPIDYDEEIQRVDMRITRYENTIKELKEERAKLEDQKKATEISALYDVIQSSGISVDQAILNLKTQLSTQNS